MQSGNVALQRYYEKGFAQFAVLDMSDEVFLQGAMLRARIGVMRCGRRINALSRLHTA